MSKAELLASIKSCDGWESFPDCIPEFLRTKSSSVVRQTFGERQLRVLRDIARLTTPPAAVQHLREVTLCENFSLEHLRQTLAHFELNSPAFSHRVSMTRSSKR